MRASEQKRKPLEKAGEKLMTGKLEHLFTYGTLKPGFANYHWIEPHVHATKPGWIRGVLVALRSFPALVEGDGIVKGVLLEIDAQGLQIADRIEGYSPNRQRNFYVRELVCFVGDDSTKSPAWTYYFARPDLIEGEPRLQCAEISGESFYAWPD